MNNNLDFIYDKINSFENYDYFDEWTDDVTGLMPQCIFEALDSFGNSECRETRCHNFKLNKYELFCEHAKSCKLVINTERTDEEQKVFDIYRNLDDQTLFEIQSAYNNIIELNS